MKAYSVREMEGGEAIELIEKHPAWVPADVAQGLYDALEESRRTIQTLIDDGYMGYIEFRSRIDAALAAADGDGK